MCRPNASGLHETASTLFAARPTPAYTKEHAMPFLNVKLIEGVFSSDQKADMIAKLTDTMVSIEGENMRPVTWVVIEEVTSGEWGIGGNALSLSLIHISE